MVLARLSTTKLLLTQHREGDGAGAVCVKLGEQLCKAHTACLCMKTQPSRYTGDHRVFQVGRDPRFKTIKLHRGLSIRTGLTYLQMFTVVA